MPEIELLKPHTHAGQACAAGQRLTVTERQAAWLLKLGVARIPEPAPELEPEPEPELDNTPVGAGFSPRPSRVRRALKDAPTTNP